MSKRDTYPPGVPCFVDTLTHDVETAKRFYGAIFGWECVGPGPIPGDPPGEYFVARVRGHDVAGIGSLPAGPQAPPPAWNTQVSVTSADETAAKARAAGGTVLVEPFDAPPAGRLAVLADPAGAVLCAWEPGARQGAALVNEPSAWAMSMLSTDDPQAAEQFYGEVFGWQAERFDAGPDVDVWLWRLPGYVGGEPQQPVPRDVVATMIRVPANGDGPPPNWSVDFWIDDADAAAQTAPGLGGTVIAPPHEMAGFRRTILADPHGAVFSASQLLSPH
jgi:hypothetical protein